MAVTVLAALVATGLTGAGYRGHPHHSPAPASLTEGIAVAPCSADQVVAVPPGRDVSYDAGDSTRLAGQCAASENSGSGARWLASGSVPGTGTVLRSMAQRSLLDLHLSVRPDGAVVAAWYGRWDYAWPRDSSWVGGGAGGHRARRRRASRCCGSWARSRARTASGPPATRPTAAARCWTAAPPNWTRWAGCRGRCGPGTRPPGPVRPLARRELAGLWPMVNAAAGAAARSLTPDGLPAGGHRLLGARQPGHAGHGGSAADRAAGGRRTSRPPWVRPAPAASGPGPPGG